MVAEDNSKILTKQENKKKPLYEVIRVTDVEPDKLQFYWQSLAQANTLHMRFPDIKDPQWLDVVEIIKTNARFMFAVRREKDSLIIGEFQMANTMGQALQLHFSTHPALSFKERVDMLHQVSSFILSRPKVSSLFGLSANVPARLILTAAGWTFHGNLKGCIKKHDGTYGDAAMMTFQR